MKIQRTQISNFFQFRNAKKIQRDTHKIRKPLLPRLETKKSIFENYFSVIFWGMIPGAEKKFSLHNIFLKSKFAMKRGRGYLRPNESFGKLGAQDSLDQNVKKRSHSRLYKHVSSKKKTSKKTEMRIYFTSLSHTVPKKVVIGVAKRCFCRKSRDFEFINVKKVG